MGKHTLTVLTVVVAVLAVLLMIFVPSGTVRAAALIACVAVLVICLVVMIRQEMEQRRQTAKAEDNPLLASVTAAMNHADAMRAALEFSIVPPANDDGAQRWALGVTNKGDEPVPVRAKVRRYYDVSDGMELPSLDLHDAYLLWIHDGRPCEAEIGPHEMWSLEIIRTDAFFLVSSLTTGEAFPPAGRYRMELVVGGRDVALDIRAVHDSEALVEIEEAKT